jgi:hypothetical protein
VLRTRNVKRRLKKTRKSETGNPELQKFLKSEIGIPGYQNIPEIENRKSQISKKKNFDHKIKKNFKD